MSIAEESLKMHYEKKGKIEVISTVEIKSKEDLSLAYTPGVAQPCLEIQKDVEKSYDLTRRWNMCLVVTDGTAVLGLGDIGPEAGMPVMEGKCALFKAFGDVDAFPLCIKSKDVDEIVRTIINGLKVTGKDKEKCKVVVNGAGSAGVAITKLLLKYGFKNVTMCDIHGIISKDSAHLNWMQREMAEVTNLDNSHGTLKDALKGADIFVGVSAPNIVSEAMVASMNKDAILFAMANPVPEIMPDAAKRAGAKVVGTGRSDFPNQVNNVLVFPGMFRGAFDVRASEINDEMKLAAAHALADLIAPDELNEDYILPAAFDARVGTAVAAAVAEAARKTGVARK